jgi:predicted nucleic acid-binding protein
MMKRRLLDPFAVLSWLQGEPVAPVVAGLLAAARASHERLFLHEVNLAEVYYLTIRRAGQDRARSIVAQLLHLPLHIVASTPEILWQAALLKAEHPLSLADAFAGATAILMDATLITGDPEFRAIGDLVEIRRI